MTPAPLTAIAAIEKAMEGVTPGTWGAHQTVIHGRAYGGHWVEVADEDQLIQISGSGGARSYTQRVFDTQGHDDNEANARYVAACNPVAMREVLALARQAEALQRENAELRAFAASFKFTCVEVSFYKDCYLHIIEPDSVSFRLNNGSQFSQFVAKLEDRRARALLGGENAGN